MGYTCSKSSRLDMFLVLFYKWCWDVIWFDVIKEIQNFFIIGRLNPYYNHTFHTLIFDVINPSRIAHYTSLSLCNNNYKIISRIIIKRLRLYLKEHISPYQVAFIPRKMDSWRHSDCWEVVLVFSKNLEEEGDLWALS